LSGKCNKRHQLGRTIGFVTANIEIPEDYKLIPKKLSFGIVTANVNKKTVSGITLI
jgi:riboflavin kinase/FMN adenylyltransferase